MKKLMIGIVAVVMMLALFAGCKSASQENVVIIESIAPTTVPEIPKETPAAAPEAEQPSVETSAEPAEPTQASKPVGKEFFDDAAFVGDSVSLKLSYYCKATKALGNAQFFTAGSLGSGNALDKVSAESVHPSYQGEKMRVEDCIEKSGVKKVFIMLGMNDIGIYGPDEAVSNYETLIDKILEKSPDVEIYVQAMTPMTSTSNIIGKNLNNDNIVKYNANLKALAERRGWQYIDVYSAVVMTDGTLNPEYCSDNDEMGIHFTEEGCQIWVDYLFENV